MCGDITIMKDRAVLCTTKDEWNAVRKKAKKKDIPDWYKLHHYSQKCIYIDTLEGFDEKPDCINRGSTVISASEYLKKPKPKGTLGINFNNIVTKLSPKQTLKHKEKEDTVLETNWKPIETAPKDRFILIKLDSGYMSYPVDTMVAQYSTAYDRWRTVQNDSVTDSHTKPPLGWMEMPS